MLRQAQGGRGLEPVPGASDALSRWAQANVSGRIILLLFPTTLFRPRAADPEENERSLAAEADLEALAVEGVERIARGMRHGVALYYVWLSPTEPPPAT